MVRLTPEMKAMVAHQRLGFMATVCKDGTPNLSPKGQTFVLDDTRLMIGEIASPQTLKNLRREPVAEINVVDPLIRKGFRFKGPCELHQSGVYFESLLELIATKKVLFVPRTIIVMRVDQAEALVSPIYQVGATESEVKEQWRAILLNDAAS